ncbi:hypothetical protein [Hamadaea tsunoensis]|uniref:hypothetical protein n=1 Tax=Hamadaea tsunoensis TaxID=53368 RepID=UPI000415EDB5|nr:hypothetical protein [Hamadaea tsunoensis]
MKMMQRAAVAVGLAVLAVVALAGPANADTSLSWSNFPTVSSEDSIRVTQIQNVAPGSVQVCLHTAVDVTWWKGIEARGWNNGKLQGVYTQNANHGTTCMTFLLSDVMYVELMKAKLFGVHTDMYRLTNATLNQRSGDTVTFDWIRDA